MIQSRRISWAGHGEKRSAHRVLVEKPEGRDQ
jgi:hypothetical protein